MKKSLIALALASSLVAGSAFAAEAALVIFGGTGQTQSAGGSSAAT